MFDYLMGGIYNFCLIGMIYWYLCLRWTWLDDEVKYWWAYKPINLATAFVTIVFLVVAFIQFNVKELLIPSFALVLNYVAFALLIRNLYYTYEDIKDYIHRPSNEQLFFIFVDVVMVLTVCFYFYFYKR